MSKISNGSRSMDESTENLIFLKKTMGRCPVCERAIPAVVQKMGNAPDAVIQMTRTCPEHGEYKTRISSDARFYWLSHGDPRNAQGESCEENPMASVAIRAGNSEPADDISTGDIVTTLADAGCDAPQCQLRRG